MKRKLSLILCVAVVLFCIAAFVIPNAFQNELCACAPIEVVVDLNDKIYSVVDSKKSPAFKDYDLEKKITPDLIGEFLGEYETVVDTDRLETFKLFRYNKCETTQYDWMPRLILEDSSGKLYHACIGSHFDAQLQTAEEVLSVYGIHSAQDILSISNRRGHEISEPDFIEKFYEGLFTKEAFGYDQVQEYINKNKDIPENEANELDSKYADTTKSLKVKLTNGLVTYVTFTSHNFVGIDHHLYFKVDDSWLELVKEIS